MEAFMVTSYKKLVVNQMKSALCTLAQCIANCPEIEWNESHGDYPFSQVVFHTLFFTDYFLERDESAFETQVFHMENKAFFRDYEELEYKEPKNLYERQKCDEYLKFCVSKCKATLQLDNQETLEGPSGFSSKPFSRAELYVHAIRHIQHHAAQLGLRIQRITGNELKWIRSGWKNDC
jgi:hypothetical protein